MSPPSFTESLVEDAATAEMSAVPVRGTRLAAGVKGFDQPLLNLAISRPSKLRLAAIPGTALHPHFVEGLFAVPIRALWETT